MADSISQKKFAPLVGISRQRVGILIGKGVLPVNEDRSIPMPAGMEAWRAFKGEAAEVIEAAPLQPTAEEPAPVPVPEIPAEPVPEEPAPSQPTPRNRRPIAAPARARAVVHGSEANLSLDLRRAQVKEREQKADTLELLLQLKRGDVISRAEVEADARALCGEIRERLLAIPPRATALLEAMLAREAGALRTSAIQTLLSDEINRVLAALHGAPYVDAPPAEAVTS